MMKQKLIALGGAVGILLCGACFGPGVYRPEPPPPIANQGIRSLRVVVIDDSAQKRFNTLALGALTASRLQQQIGYNGIAAYSEEKPLAEVDAELRARVLSAEARMNPPADLGFLQDWVFSVKFSEQLMRKDGSILWQGAEQTEIYSLKSYARNPEDVWKDPVPQGVLMNRFAARFSWNAVNQFPNVTANADTLPEEASPKR